MVKRRATLTPERLRNAGVEVLREAAGMGPGRPDSLTESQKNALTESQRARETEKVKATFYLPKEDVALIDRIQAKLFLESPEGRRVPRSDIVCMALRYWAKQLGIEA